MDKKLQKGIITAAVVVVAALVVSRLLKPKSGAGVSSGGGDTQGGEGSTQVSTNLDFRSLANQIFDACDGYGTSANKIKEIFKLLKSNADYDALKSAYGVREVSSGAGNIFVSNFEGDLAATLRDELRSGQLEELNQILTSNGISRTI